MGKLTRLPPRACITGFAVSSLCAALTLSSSCIQRAGPIAPAAGVTTPSRESSAPAPATVVVALTEHHQTLEGFGASVAFYIDRALGDPSPEFYRLLFPDLGVDILRFRNRYGRSDPEDGDLRQEVEILQRATEALGHPPRIMLSSWSPPASLKANGTERCHGNADCTLKKENGQFVYEQFARYWGDSLAHYASLGIVPEFITIQNEPDFIPPYWEGCKFEASESEKYPSLGRALSAVHARIATTEVRPKILAPEVIGVHWGTVRKYLQGMAPDSFDAVAHHLYEKGDDGIWDWRNPGPESFVAPMKEVADAARGRAIFQTEFQTDEDGGIEGGFETAWLIHNSLVEEGAAAFLYWNLLWKFPGGLVSVDGSRHKVRDQYYSLKHYARFTDPGYVRIGARASSADLRVSAFLAPAGDRVTVVVLNTGPQAIEARVQAPGFSASGVSAYRTVYRPGESETWKELGSSGGDMVISLPARSVATVVFAGHAD